MTIQSMYVTSVEKMGKNFLNQVEGSRARQIEETFKRFCAKSNEITAKTKEEELEGAL